MGLPNLDEGEFRSEFWVWGLRLGAQSQVFQVSGFRFRIYLKDQKTFKSRGPIPLYSASLRARFVCKVPEPQLTYLFQHLYKETILRNPETAGVFVPQEEFKAGSNFWKGSASSLDCGATTAGWLVGLRFGVYGSSG